MSINSIDQALVTQFSDMVHHQAQQLNSRLRPFTKVQQFSGDVWAYDGLGRVEAREVQGRNVAANFDNILHNRRKVARRRFVINLPVDSSDVRGALLNPNSEYSKAVAAGMLRQYDRVIYQAAFADVLTGRDFETNVTATTDGVLVVDATAGLTYEKMLEIKQNFFDNDVGIDANENLYLTIGGDEHTDLMSEIELTSGDFTREFVVEKGRITQGLGMSLVGFASNVPNPIIPTAGGERQLVAASDRGIVLGISKEMSIKIQERNDLIETTQIQVIAEIGAVRTEGALVQRVRVTA